MKNQKAKVSQSRDLQWVRWSVIREDAETLWFYTEIDAKNYAAAVNAGDEDKQATMRLRAAQ